MLKSLEIKDIISDLSFLPTKYVGSIIDGVLCLHHHSEIVTLPATGGTAESLKDDETKQSFPPKESLTSDPCP